MEISERPVCPQFSQFSPDHLDWLGSSRFMSNPHQNTAVGAVAYAPFGESYNKTSAMRLDFTDQFQDSNIANTYDFPARKMNVVQGRWLSPDPGGLAAMDLTNPQTFNRYAYVGNNPLAAVDPLGLCDEDVGNDCGGGGAGGVPGYCPPSMEYCGDPPFPPIGVGGGGGGGVGGGAGGGSAEPPAAPSPVPSPTNPNGPPSFGCENLGIPCGLPFPQGGLLDALGIDPGCEFGPCVPIGSGVVSGVTGAGTADAPFVIDVTVWARFLQSLLDGTSGSGRKIRPFTLPLPNVPSGAACNAYGSRALKLICNVEPNNPTNNCVRGNLLDSYDLTTGYRGGIRDAHCIAFASCAMSRVNPAQLFFFCNF